MQAGSILGHPVRRVEDPDLLTGAARFVADLPVESLHAVFVRSPFAHARITAVDLDEARGMPGVAGIFVGADLGLAPMTPGTVPLGFGRPVLAEGVVRFVGEPVAVVVAETSAQAMDAAELVSVDYDPLPVVVDPVAALDDEGPLLFPEERTNVAMDSDVGDPRALDRADVVVRARFVNQRLAPMPMEGNAALAEPDMETGGLTVWASCQAP